MYLMDSLDKSILNALQFDFPLVVKPFAAIAAKLGVAEQDVLNRIAELKKNQTVRQISAIFDSSKIGYVGVLVAFKVPKRSLNAVAQQINAHPGVSHNYVRSDKFNLWFTLTVPSDIDLKKEASRLAKKAGVLEWLFLPTIRKFKISFQLDMNGKSHTAARKHASASSAGTLAVSRPFVRELQKDLPLLSRPFAPAAEALGWTEGNVVRELKRYIRTGAIRRFASVLRPVNAGFPANVLTVWAPRKEQVSVLGTVAAANKNVSHCYERPAFPTWPYSVYTMIHGRSLPQCDKVIRAISKESGVTSFKKLTSVKEYKKIRVEYFPENKKTPKINANSKSGKGSAL
jgi:DNA-binding Lrp family transcriptional regulator